MFVGVDVGVDLDPLAGLEGPSEEELAALVAEEAQIEAELARLEAELARWARRWPR